VEGSGVIVGRKGTVGSLYWEDNSFYPIDTVFYIKPIGKISLEFAYYLFQTLGLEYMNTDAAVPGLNRKNVYRLEVPGFDEELVACFTDNVKSIRKIIASLLSEIYVLKNIRDTLLPKLLSGELSVDAAKLAEEN
jgi:type I restriction enzyme S subunit